MIEIRPFEKADTAAALGLHRRVFEPLYGVIFTYVSREIAPFARPGRAVVAESESGIVGFGVYFPLREAPETLAKLHRRAADALDPLNDARAYDAITRFMFLRDDVVLGGLAVSEKARHQGIATSITKTCVDAARDLGAPNVIAECYERGGSPGIYRRLGFEELFWRPKVFPDGSAQLVMACSLR